MTSVFPDWSGETAAVIAGGQSTAHLAPLIRGRCRIIVVNLAFRLVPDADVLYAADGAFWAHYRDSHAFDGLKLSAGEYAGKVCPGVHLVRIAKDRGNEPLQDMQRAPVGTVGNGGGNGGFQAVNLAVQFGARTILLAGLDYAGRHWHPDHAGGTMRNPVPEQLARWQKCMDAQAELLDSWGVKVINLSLDSSLRAFPHGSPDRDLPHPRATLLSA